MTRDRINYIEWLRIVCAIAVVGIHITMTQPNNYSVAEIGTCNYLVLTSVYVLIQWAVPVFLMISGNLLLHSHMMSFSKVKKMISRMTVVLLLFGSIFALLEQVFEKKTVELWMLPNSFFLTLQQKSWSHLWYLYVLIGIYVILMPLKKFVDNSSNREICVFTAILVIGNVIVPTINIVFETEIENYMLLTQYVTYVLLGYIIGGLHGDDSDGIKNAISLVIYWIHGGTVAFSLSWRYLLDRRHPLAHDQTHPPLVRPTLCTVLLHHQIHSSSVFDHSGCRRAGTHAPWWFRIVDTLETQHPTYTSIQFLLSKAIGK